MALAGFLAATGFAAVLDARAFFGVALFEPAFFEAGALALADFVWDFVAAFFLEDISDLPCSYLTASQMKRR